MNRSSPGILGRGESLCKTTKTGEFAGKWTEDGWGGSTGPGV